MELIKNLGFKERILGFLRKSKLKRTEEDSHKGLFLKPLILTSVFEILLLFFLFHLYGFSGLMGAARLSNGSSPTLGVNQVSIFTRVFSNLEPLKFPFMLKIFEPVAFLPFLSIYVLPILFYIIVAWYSNVPVYYDTPIRQYTAAVVPFVFISVVKAFKLLVKHKRIQYAILFILVIFSLFGFLYQSPFSLNNLNQARENATVTKFENQLSYGLSLIPTNSSVFVENALPQAMNHPIVYMPGYYDKQVVDYAIIIPKNYNFSLVSTYYNYSPHWTSYFENNTAYGIFENISGVLIYKWHYNGWFIACGSAFSTKTDEFVGIRESP